MKIERATNRPSRNKEFISNVLVALLLISNVYSAVDKVKFEVMKKPEVVLPASVNKILVADNFISPKSYRYHDFVYNNRAFVDRHNIDSLLSISATDGFRTVINESAVYGVNDESIYFSPYDTSRCKYPVHRDVAMKTMKAQDAELMFVLHDINVIDVLDVSEYSGYYMSDFVVHYIASWKRYDLKDSIYYSYNFKVDTVQYRGMGYTEDNSLANIPDRYTAIGYAAFKAGQEMGKSVAPHWETVERSFYVFSIPELEPTNKMLQSGSVEKAVEIWKIYTMNKNKNIASQSAFNIAVACEMLDKLDLANEWIDKSIAIKQNRQNLHYKSILEQRIIEREVMKGYGL